MPIRAHPLDTVRSGSMVLFRDDFVPLTPDPAGDVWQMSKDMFGCRTGDRRECCRQLVGRGRDDATHPTMDGTNPTTENFLAFTVNCVKAEKFCASLALEFRHQVCGEFQSSFYMCL